MPLADERDDLGFASAELARLVRMKPTPNRSAGQRRASSRARSPRLSFPPQGCRARASILPPGRA